MTEFKVKVASDALATFISAVYDVTRGAFVKFGPSLMTCNANDSVGTMMVSAGVTIETNLTEIVEIQLDFEALNGLTLTGGVTEFNVTPGMIQVNAGRAVYKVRGITDPSIKHAKIPEKPWPIVLKVKSSDLTQSLQAVYGVLDKKDAASAINFLYDGNFVIGDRGWEKVNVTFDKSEFELLSGSEGKWRSMFSADLVKIADKHVRKFTDVTIKLGNNYPMAIGGSANGLGIGFLLAPRIDEE